MVTHARRGPGVEKLRWHAGAESRTICIYQPTASYGVPLDPEAQCRQVGETSQGGGCRPKRSCSTSYCTCTIDNPRLFCLQLFPSEFRTLEATHFRILVTQPSDYPYQGSPPQTWFLVLRRSPGQAVCARVGSGEAQADRGEH